MKARITVRHGRVATVMAVILVLSGLTGSAAAWAAPVNDDISKSLPLQLGNADTRSNVGAGVEPGERLTANDPNGFGCDRNGSAASGGIRMGATLWWEFTGNGGPVTVSSLGSNFDSLLAVYEGAGGPLVGCNDDIQPHDFTRPNLGARLASELLVNTVVGRRYLVQLGGCAEPAPRCGAVTSGTATLRVSATPPNDDRAAATPVAAGSSIPASNTGATVESGEVTSCRRFDGREAPYAKTVWFRYTAPAIGTAVFSASGFDTVLAVYRGDSPTPLGCNDDAVDKEFGASRLPMSQPAGPLVNVFPGDYLIQVGGYYDPGFTTVAARNGPLSVQVEFTRDIDIDNDGVIVGQDCNDQNPQVHPGAREVPNNDADENCDGVQALDRDGDRALAYPAGNDCRDDEARIHPGAREIAGNGIDDDCYAGDTPFPQLEVKFQLVWQNLGRKTRVLKLLVRDVPAGTTIELRCRGRGCGRSQRLVVKRRRARVSMLKTLRRSLRRRAGKRIEIRAGTRIEIRATKRGFSGKSRVYRMRRGNDPSFRDYCLRPMGRRPC